MTSVPAYIAEFNNDDFLAFFGNVPPDNLRLWVAATAWNKMTERGLWLRQCDQWDLHSSDFESVEFIEDYEGL